ncbi:cyclase family protein [Catenulispora rubra]|uniref:cyclase family protein n=1 Tax=Catenulispora rubra TaxID=280293 RepID=UPI00189274E5|nr:cyclase family protein [Catenulispora rubra]
MRIVDLTHGFYQGMPAYPAGWFPEFGLERRMTPDTDPAPTTRTFSQLHLFPHNGTHIEYRLHFFPDAEGIDAVPLETLVGRACVADLSHVANLTPITGDDIEKRVGDIWQRGDRLLVRTDYVSRAWGRPDYWDVPPYLAPSAAEWAVDNGASLVGIDCLTERPGDGTSPVHLTLLTAGIPIAEYLTNMHELTRQVVQLYALPIKVRDSEAAPARVIAIEAD